MNITSVLEYIRTVVPGICEVRDTRTNHMHMYKGWVVEALDDGAYPQQFTPDFTPDGEWIEVFLEHGELGDH